MAKVHNRVRELVRVAREKARELEPSSLVRQAATDGWFDEIAEAHPPEREPDYLPPLLMQLYRLSVKQLRAFDADLAMVRALSPFPERTASFVAAGAQVDHRMTRQWYAGIAELAVLAHLAENVDTERLRIEPELPNGKRADAAVQVGERWVWLEVSALTTSNAAIAEFDPAAAVAVKMGDPYEDARRMYRKVYDKVVGEGDKPKSRLHPADPTVVVVVDGSLGGSHDSLGYEWAIAQLLDPTQRETSSRASLPNWIDHDYPGSQQTALNALQQLSGLAVQGYGLGHRTLVANQDADADHRLTDAETANLERLLRVDRPWMREPESP